MLGNPNFRTGTVHPFHRPVAITDLAPQAGTLQQVLAAELASSLWSRQEAGLDPLPSPAKARTRAKDSRIWRDQLLAEIEVLTEMLKEKVARYSSLRANRRPAEVGERADETAVMWIQDALEDVAATALGIEIASRELFLQAASAGEQDWERNTGQEQTGGNAE